MSEISQVGIKRLNSIRKMSCSNLYRGISYSDLRSQSLEANAVASSSEDQPKDVFQMS